LKIFRLGKIQFLAQLPKRRFKMHIYLVTNLTVGKQYIGAEKGNDPEYFGSGKLIIKAIEKFGKKNFKKEILINDIKSQEELNEIESYFIMGLDTIAPKGYNQKIYSWPPSSEAFKRGRDKQAKEKLGIHAPENIGKGGKISGKKVAKRNQELGKAIFTPGMKSKGGKIGGRIAGKIAVEKKKGCFDPANKGRTREGKVRGGKNSAHILFCVDGILQRVTLGAILGM